MNQFSLRQKIIFLVIPLLLVGLALFFDIKSAQFSVASSDPHQSDRIPTYGSIIVNYTDPINANKVRISPQPTFNYTVKTAGKQLTIIPQDKLLNTTVYTVRVDNVCATAHASSCVSYTLHFTADDSVPYSALSAAQQKQVTSQVDSQYHQSPILSILPVNQTDFLINAHPLDSMTYVVITPNLDPGTLTEDEFNTTYNQFLNEGKKYLTDKGYPLQSSTYKVVSDQEYAQVITALNAD